MRVLVACEFSGRVRDAFARRGHDAWSCDLDESDAPGNHIEDDVRNHLDKGWDLMVAHPPCTYLARSGLSWGYDNPQRQAKTEEALDFVCDLMNAPIERIAIENPMGCISTRIRKPDQYVHPWWFGHDAAKKTGLWLKNLPLLTPTNVIRREVYANQTPTGQNAVGPCRMRWYLRSVTYEGVAEAMAEQWSLHAELPSNVLEKQLVL